MRWPVGTAVAVGSTTDSSPIPTGWAWSTEGEIRALGREAPPHAACGRCVDLAVLLLLLLGAGGRGARLGSPSPSHACQALL